MIEADLGDPYTGSNLLKLMNAADSITEVRSSSFFHKESWTPEYLTNLFNKGRNIIWATPRHVVAARRARWVSFMGLHKFELEVYNSADGSVRWLPYNQYSPERVLSILP